MAAAKLDVVIPLFNEMEIVDQLHSRVVNSCRETGVDYRIIYVDDGGSDGTAEWIESNAVDPDPLHSPGDAQSKVVGDKLPPENLFAQAPLGSSTESEVLASSISGSVTLIRLSRNFGQPAAILAGLSQSDGSCVVVMDGDLQDPPELIPEMFQSWQDGNKVVIAQRKSRQESFLRGLAFKTFHKLFKYLSDSAIPPNTGTFCLLDRRAANTICDLPESHRFFPGLRAWVGFRQTRILFDRQARAGGQPKQTFFRLLRYALDAVFGFSLKPLRVLTGSGVAICCISFLLAAWFIFKRLIGWEDASIGFTTLTCAVFGLGGFQLIGLGILGEYIGRIYDEVKGRPQFVIAELLTLETNSNCKNDEASLESSMPVNQRKAG